MSRLHKCMPVFVFLKQLLVLIIPLFFFYTIANCQELEPRNYANVPKNMNAIGFTYGFLKGNVVTDPSLPLADFKITSNNLGLAYVRTFALANKLARIQVAAPFVIMAGTLKVNGRDTSGGRTGFADMRIRFGINFFGSPALDKKDFPAFQQKTIVGISVVVSVPTGLYYTDKLINIGTNRWGIKPEVGISRRFKHVYAETYMGVWFYTDNSSYLGNKTLVQNPVFSIQGHASYHFKNQMWIGINANWFTGGDTYVDNKLAGDLHDNWRLGGTFSTPLTRSQSLKLQFNGGAFIAKGLNYNSVTLSYQYIFF